MDQEDINDLIAKNPSPEAIINSTPLEGYSKLFIIKTVDSLFHKYASSYRQDALNDLQKILEKK